VNLKTIAIICAAVLIGVIAVVGGLFLIMPQVKDCGDSPTCLASEMLTCEMAKGRIVTPSVTMYEEIRGVTNGRCQIYMRMENVSVQNTSMSASSRELVMQLEGADITCNFPMANGYVNMNMAPSDMISSCSGSLMDRMMSMADDMFYAGFNRA